MCTSASNYPSRRVSLPHERIVVDMCRTRSIAIAFALSVGSIVPPPCGLSPAFARTVCSCAHNPRMLVCAQRTRCSRRSATRRRCATTIAVASASSSRSTSPAKCVRALARACSAHSSLSVHVSVKFVLVFVNGAQVVNAFTSCSLQFMSS